VDDVKCLTPCCGTSNCSSSLPPPPLPLRVGERGLALLYERGHALLLVPCGEGCVEDAPLEPDTLRQGHLVRCVDGLLGHGDDGL